MWSAAVRRISTTIGVAKNAREEKAPRSRREAAAAQKRTGSRDGEAVSQARSRREQQPEGGFVPLTSIAPAAAPQQKKEEVGSFGD